MSNEREDKVRLLLRLSAIVNNREVLESLALAGYVVDLEAYAEMMSELYGGLFARQMAEVNAMRLDCLALAVTPFVLEEPRKPKVTAADVISAHGMGVKL